MALLAFDGFDSYASTDQMLTRQGYLQWTSFTQGFIGSGFSLEPTENDGQRFVIGPTNSVGGDMAVLSFASYLQRAYLGMRIKVRSGMTEFRFYDSFSGLTCFSLFFNRLDCSIRSTIGNSRGNVFPADSEVFVEIGWTIATAGSIDIRINTVPVATFRGNTQPSVNNKAPVGVNIIDIHALGDTENSCISLDDVYVCDTTLDASAPGTNTYLGNRRVYLLRANANVGTPGWTPGGGDPNWANIARPDVATVNRAQAPGAEDLFIFEPLPSDVVSIVAVQIVGEYRKDAGSTAVISQRLNSGGVEAAAPQRPDIPSNFTFVHDMFKLDPATGQPWNVAGLSPAAFKAGYRMDS